MSIFRRLLKEIGGTDIFSGTLETGNNSNIGDENKHWRNRIRSQIRQVIMDAVGSGAAP